MQQYRNACDNRDPFRAAPVISLARYATLLERPELRRTIIASVVGRLPIGILGLAILLATQAARGSFGLAGAVAACYLAGLATMAPVLGRLIDRTGPARVLLVAALMFPATLMMLVTALHFDAPLWTAFALAALAGASFPPITVCLRTFLRQRLLEEAQLATAYSLESVLIEIIFIIGPMLVALFVAYLSAGAAILFAAGCGCAGTLLFLRSPAIAHWRIEQRNAPSLFGPLGVRGFVPLLAVILAYSGAFGLLEIGVTAFAAEAGMPALAGLILGLMSIGSALGGLAYGSRNWHLPLPQQFALMLLLMGGGIAALGLIDNAVAFTVLGIAAGIVMAPALIMQSMLVARTAPPQYATEAFTWATSCLLTGVGLGLGAGGLLLEHARSPAVFGTAGAVSAGAALLAYASLRRG
jgi:predicted MFS family arabinose efflux permease